jgi:hypothetical protein
MKSELMCMEPWRNDSERGKQNYLGRNLSHRQFFYHKPNMDYYGIDPGLPRWEVVH